MRMRSCQPAKVPRSFARNGGLGHAAAAHRGLVDGILSTSRGLCRISQVPKPDACGTTTLSPRFVAIPSKIRPSATYTFGTL